MAVILLAAFIAVPLIEIGVFIEVGGLIGLWSTLGLVILTAMVGTWQLRAQGLATLSRARSQMDRGIVPAHELFDGLCLLVAGALLLTPGFVTDGLGLLLFLPPFRAFLRGWAARHMQAHGQARVWVDGQEVRRGPGSGVIDGDYEDLTGRRGGGEDPEDEGDKGPGRLPR